MFKKLYNEAIISYNIETVSPLFIRSGEEDPLNPISAEHSYLVLYKDGKLLPVIPGTSFKGVFRSRAEAKLRSHGHKICDLFGYNCGKRILKKEKKEKTKLNGEERYIESCPVCKLFGSTALKGRAEFSDAFPTGEYRVGKRMSVAIDRITGAAKHGALFDFEYIEYCNFEGSIKIRNFLNWHIKLLLDLFQDLDTGFITFGGLTSKGFGRMKINNIDIKIRYYDKAKQIDDYRENEFYIEKDIKGLENALKTVNNVTIDLVAVEGCDLQNEQTL